MLTNCRSMLAAGAGLLWLCLAGPLACGEVTVLQNGVSPTPEYAGCKDTWISDNRWEQKRDYSGQPTMRSGSKRNVLIQFDLSSVPGGHVVHKAVLRLANVGYPKKRRGKADWPTYLYAYRIARPWSPNANWVEHTAGKTRTQAGEAWKTPGGDLDVERDFGLGSKGVLAGDVLIDGPAGHVHELDVTAVVKGWHSGELANHGLALVAAEKMGCDLASCEWHVPAYRPKLVISHGPRDAPAAAIAPLPRAPKEIQLDAVAATPAAGEPAEYATIRAGRNSNCALRGASTDAYVKEAVERFPGAWGWMNMCRVGGRGGDFSRALLYFDLGGIPRTASIKRARLVLTLTPYTNREVGGYRYGAFLLKLPGAPGWRAEEVTAAQRKAGVSWPAGGVVACSAGEPAGIGKVVMKEVTVRGRKRRVPGTIEFDLTGAVRAWVQGKEPNCGVVLDNRIQGGAYDFYSSRSFNPEFRPYLEVEVSPAVAMQPEPIKLEPGLPPGDYWVEPMRQIHKRFKGKPGTLAQYGDSITVTMAFLSGFSYGKGITAKNCTPEVQAELDAITSYADRTLWRQWKGWRWGCEGQMKSDWFLANIDGWQKKMNPEVGVILFGTNDIAGLAPPEYTENMAAAVRRMLTGGTVPMLTTVPPKSGADHVMADYYLALVSVARELKIPVIDYYAEIMRRRPDDWNGRLDKFKDRKGYQVLTLISGDGVHPSNPKEYVNDFGEQALSNNGFVLRNYMTLRKYHEVIAKVLQAKEQ